MSNQISKDNQSATVIRFVLGGQIKTLANFDPTTTVLQYLRETNFRTGTKEACGQGGCGACTVVIVDLNKSDWLRYRTANACLLLLPQLDGLALFTVEDLKSPDGQLHPVQQAMIDGHASQCGYCTPGIVMSLFALYQSGQSFDREKIVSTLAGNLCRCTGYRSIIDAALSLNESDQAMPCSNEQSLCELLISIKRDQKWSIQSDDVAAKKVLFLVPADVAEFSEMIQQHPDAILLAGGTDIAPKLIQQPQNYETVILIGKLTTLREINVTNKNLSIGAATTVEEALPIITQHFPAFGELLFRFGSLAIRNLATFAGNIAGRSPVGDTLPALIALNSTMVLRKGSTRRSVSVEAFQKGELNNTLVTGELIESIQIPLLQDATVFSVYKLSKRQDCDIAAVNAAFYLELNNQTICELRMCYGGMGSQVRRAYSCERALVGKTWTQETIENVLDCLLEDFQPISDVRGSSLYRMSLAQNLLRRFYLESTFSQQQFQVSTYQKIYE